MELDIKLYNAEQKAGRKMQVWPEVCGGKLVITNVNKEDAQLVEDIFSAAARLVALALRDDIELDEARAFEALEERFEEQLSEAEGEAEEAGEPEPEPDPRPRKRRATKRKSPARKKATRKKRTPPPRRDEEGDITDSLIADAAASSQKGPTLHRGQIR